LHAPLETGGIGDIQLTETGSGPGCGPGPELGVDVAEDHLIALPGESLYNSLSDSAGAARNEYTSFHVFLNFYRKDSASRLQRQEPKPLENDPIS
jgi:hypothetical protein